MKYNTLISPIEIKEENNKIIQVSYINNSNIANNIENNNEKETPLIKQTYQQIMEYLEGKRIQFDVPIQLKGTIFQLKVWNALLSIPYGQTRSYQDIANQIGSPKACRAVGMANHSNPIAIIVPCHRVIGKNNQLVGYAGGLDIKQKLLQIEQNN